MISSAKRLFLSSLVFTSLALNGSIVMASNRLAEGINCPTEGIFLKNGAEKFSLKKWSDFEKILNQKQHIFIGERHGVIKHPLTAACILSALKTPQASVIMEQISAKDQPKIDSYREANPEISGGLGKALKWWRSGWPDWSIYAPLVAEVWFQRFALKGGDLPSTEPTRDAEGLQKFYQKDWDTTLLNWATILNKGQCGLLSKEEAHKQAVSQMNRDIWFSQLMEKAVKPVVLYAGRSHTRRDMSVPMLQINASQIAATDQFVIVLHETGNAGVKVNQSIILADYEKAADAIIFVGDATEKDICSILKQ